MNAGARRWVTAASVVNWAQGKAEDSSHDFWWCRDRKIWLLPLPTLRMALNTLVNNKKIKYNLQLYVLLEPSQMEDQWPRGAAFMLRLDEECVWTKGPDVIIIYRLRCQPQQGQCVQTLLELGVTLFTPRYRAGLPWNEGLQMMKEGRKGLSFSPSPLPPSSNGSPWGREGIVSVIKLGEEEFCVAFN